MLVLLSLLACGPGHQDQPAAPGEAPKPSAGKMIQVKGSDTLVNVAQAWAEAFHAKHPEVAIAVSGGGSGTGIAALENKTADIANASRELHANEKDKIKAATGKEPIEHTVAWDALAVYVHRDNPMEKITKEQIASIYAEKGTANKWSDLGVTVPGCSDGSIVRISRQNNSGTYEYFREWALDKGDFKLGSRDMQGSKDVVDAVKQTPCAIGYSGMGYKTDEVKWLAVTLTPDAPGVLPAVETVHDKTYPISRALYMYTVGEPTGPAGDYLAWIKGPEGQAIVERSGFVPLPKDAPPAAATTTDPAAPAEPAKTGTP